MANNQLFLSSIFLVLISYLSGCSKTRLEESPTLLQCGKDFPSHIQYLKLYDENGSALNPKAVEAFDLSNQKPISLHSSDSCIEMPKDRVLLRSTDKSGRKIFSILSSLHEIQSGAHLNLKSTDESLYRFLCGESAILSSRFDFNQMILATTSNVDLLDSVIVSYKVAADNPLQNTIPLKDIRQNETFLGLNQLVDGHYQIQFEVSDLRTGLRGRANCKINLDSKAGSSQINLGEEFKFEL